MCTPEALNERGIVLKGCEFRKKYMTEALGVAIRESMCFFMHFFRDFCSSRMKSRRYNWWLSDPEVATIFFWVFWTVHIWTFWDFFVFETTWRGFRHEAVSWYSWLRTESEWIDEIHLWFLWSHICTHVAWSDASCNNSSAYMHLLAFVGTCNLKSCQQLVATASCITINILKSWKQPWMAASGT